MSKMLEVGKVVGTHGLKGELRFVHWCDDYSAFDRITKLYTSSGDVFSFDSIKPHKNVSLLKLSEIDTIEDAEKLHNVVLLVQRSEITISEDSFFLQDILNLSAYSENGKYLGEITDWMEARGKKTYILKNGSEKYLIPAEFIIDVGEKVTIKLIEGLIE